MTFFCFVLSALAQDCEPVEPKSEPASRDEIHEVREQVADLRQEFSEQKQIQDEILEVLKAVVEERKPAARYEDAAVDVLATAPEPR